MDIIKELPRLSEQDRRAIRQGLLDIANQDDDVAACNQSALEEAGGSAEQVARDVDISVAQVSAALAYAAAYPVEINLDTEESEANRHRIGVQESAWQAGHRGGASRPRNRR